MEDQGHTNGRSSPHFNNEGQSQFAAWQREAEQILSHLSRDRAFIEDSSHISISHSDSSMPVDPTTLWPRGSPEPSSRRLANSAANNGTSSGRGGDWDGNQRFWSPTRGSIQKTETGGRFEHAWPCSSALSPSTLFLELGREQITPMLCLGVDARYTWNFPVQRTASFATESVTHVVNKLRASRPHVRMKLWPMHDSTHPHASARKLT